MSAVDDYSPEWHVEDDELVRRLRNLEWAPVPVELRQRCWDDFSQRVAQRSSRTEHAAGMRAPADVGDRYDFRRFVATRRLAVAQASVPRYTPRMAFSVT